MNRPIAGSCRPSKQRRINLHTETPALGDVKHDFSLKPTSPIKPFRQPKGAPKLPPRLRKGAVLALPFGVTYSQERNLDLQAPFIGIERLTRHTHRLAAATKLPSTKNYSSPSKPITGGEDNDWGFHFDPGSCTVSTQNSPVKPQQHGRYRGTCNVQAHRWQHEILPLVLHPFMELRRTTLNGRRPPESAPSSLMCSCHKPRIIRVILVRWDCMFC